MRSLAAYNFACCDVERESLEKLHCTEILTNKTIEKYDKNFRVVSHEILQAWPDQNVTQHALKHVIRRCFAYNKYNVSQKTKPLMFDNNFGKCGPIFKILSQIDS